MTDREKIYEEYSKKVFGYLYKSVNNQHVAEDLCGDVFVKIYNKLDTFNPEKASLSTWIYNITRNTLYDYYRTNHPSGELTDDMIDEDLDESSSHEEELKSLSKALLKLDDRERYVIVERFYRHKTLQEIAKDIGISYFRVRSIHSESLKKLKNLMERE